MSKEIWKDVNGYEGYYQVSNIGNVRSLDRPSTSPVNKIELGTQLKPSIKRGYSCVVLQKDGERKHTSIHRIVAQAFICNRENKPQVNHINGVKSDNRAKNLEWATSSENIQHAYKTGLSISRTGQRHHFSKLKKEDIPLIRSLFGSLSSKVIGARFGVSRGCIDSIKYGITWNHTK
jgi:hypothetical protein